MAKVMFDGIKEADRMAEFLEDSEKVLGKSLVILQSDGMSSESSYVRLKREMGERLGVLVSVQITKDIKELKSLLREANEDDTVDGVMVQLPILGAGRDETDQILYSINPVKDVDGLNPKSRFEPAVVRAVERLIDIFKIDGEDKIALVGANGAIGSRLLKRFRSLDLKVMGFDIGDDLTKLTTCNVVIGSTGSNGIVEGSMVQDGFVGIDLGYPRGDFSKEAIEKAGLMTPVPGGVGPMTIVALYENLADQ